MKVAFSLLKASVTLVNEDQSAVTLYNNDFSVNVGIFDTSNKYNKRSLTCDLNNKQFGVTVTAQNQDRMPFILQKNQDKLDALELQMSLSNIVHKESDLPPS